MIVELRGELRLEASGSPVSSADTAVDRVFGLDIFHVINIAHTSLASQSASRTYSTHYGVLMLMLLTSYACRAFLGVAKVQAGRTMPSTRG